MRISQNVKFSIAIGGFECAIPKQFQAQDRDAKDNPSFVLLVVLNVLQIANSHRTDNNKSINFPPSVGVIHSITKNIALADNKPSYLQDVAANASEINGMLTLGTVG